MKNLVFSVFAMMLSVSFVGCDTYNGEVGESPTPLEITDLVVVDSTKNSITLGWTNPAENFAYAKLSYQREGEDAVEPEEKYTESAVTVTGLTYVKDKPYTFTVTPYSPDDLAGEVANITANCKGPMISLSESMISTNAPLLYKTWGNQPDGFWTENKKAITEGQAAARQAKCGTFSNMWDGNPATCYSTNYDIYEVGTSGTARDVVPDHYIQIDFGEDVKKLKVSITAAADPCARLLNIQFKIKGSNSRSFRTLCYSSETDGRKSFPEDAYLCTSNELREFELTSTSAFSSLRICATHGSTTVGGIIMDENDDHGCGYFGIAELALEKIE